MTSAAANQAYPVIAAAIRYIQDSAPRQPDLAGLADYTGYSADHLQRMFSQWAGISPKRFLQFLTAQFARQQLQQGRDVLSVSMAAGLSSPGRLHELIVTLESVTPGELATGGAGITITWGVATCPLGVLLGGITERGVCFLRFITDSEQTAFNELSEQWYGAANVPGFLNKDSLVSDFLVDVFVINGNFGGDFGSATPYERFAADPIFQTYFDKTQGLKRRFFQADATDTMIAEFFNESEVDLIATYTASLIPNFNALIKIRFICIISRSISINESCCSFERTASTKGWLHKFCKSLK